MEAERLSVTFPSSFTPGNQIVLYKKERKTLYDWHSNTVSYRPSSHDCASHFSLAPSTSGALTCGPFKTPGDVRHPLCVPSGFENVFR